MNKISTNRLYRCFCRLYRTMKTKKKRRKITTTRMKRYFKKLYKDRENATFDIDVAYNSLRIRIRVTMEKEQEKKKEKRKEKYYNGN